jgi:hypothetical protein
MGFYRFRFDSIVRLKCTEHLNESDHNCNRPFGLDLQNQQLLVDTTFGHKRIVLADKPDPVVRIAVDMPDLVARIVVDKLEPVVRTVVDKADPVERIVVDILEPVERIAVVGMGIHLGAVQRMVALAVYRPVLEVQDLGLE